MWAARAGSDNAPGQSKACRANDRPDAAVGQRERRGAGNARHQNGHRHAEFGDDVVSEVRHRPLPSAADVAIRPHRPLIPDEILRISVR
jgi:hypothetical protein